MKNQSKNESRIFLKTIAALICFLLLLFSIWMFEPMQIGLVEMSTGENLARYTGLIRDKRDNQALIEILETNSAPKAQVIAIISMSVRQKSAENVAALVRYIKNENIHHSMRILAVWALGELKAESTRDFLISLRTDPGFNKYELNKAIKKIDGEYGLFKRIRNQF